MPDTGSWKATQFFSALATVVQFCSALATVGGGQERGGGQEGQFCSTLATVVQFCSALDRSKKLEGAIELKVNLEDGITNMKMRAALKMRLSPNAIRNIFSLKFNSDIAPYGVVELRDTTDGPKSSRNVLHKFRCCSAQSPQIGNIIARPHSA
jgi:hypothetical protein